MIEVEMTSLDIANMCEKKHFHILRDIREKLIPQIDESKNGCIFSVKKTTYYDLYKREKESYTLNKYAANALVANYKMKHAMLVVEHLHALECKVQEQQRQLEVMKNIVWEVINGQAYISQEQALKMAGIKHPRLFMRYLKSSSNFYDSVVNERNFLKNHQCNKHGDKWWKFTKEGFQWLLQGKVHLNDWVEKCKIIEKQNKQAPC